MKYTDQQRLEKIYDNANKLQNYIENLTDFVEKVISLNKAA